MAKALFLDRDGVINEDTGYAHDPDDITLVWGLVSFLHKAQRQGYIIIVVTNQSGIGRGYYKVQDYHLYMHALQRKLKSKGCNITADYYCPHKPEDGCECRKPLPGMIHKAVNDFGIDLRKSVLIGDHYTDIEAGLAAGVGKLHLFNGKEWPRI